MKVYIKPWDDALKSAKKFRKRFVYTVNDMDYICSISHRHGNWGHVVEAKKENSGECIWYDTGFIYPACCVEEITPKWLEEHASKFYRRNH